MVNGKTTKPMDTESTLMLTGLNMKDIGGMIFSMGMVLKHGVIAQNTRATIMKVKNMVKAPIHGLMDQNMWEIGLTIKSMVKVSTHG